MKEYLDLNVEIVYFKEDVVKTSGVPLPDDEFGTEIGGF